MKPTVAKPIPQVLRDTPGSSEAYGMRSKVLNKQRGRAAATLLWEKAQICPHTEGRRGPNHRKTPHVKAAVTRVRGTHSLVGIRHGVDKVVGPEDSQLLLRQVAEVEGLSWGGGGPVMGQLD